MLYFTIHDLEAQWWRHPYPYQSFAVILGFIIIFRCDLPHNPGSCKILLVLSRQSVHDWGQPG